VALYNDYDVVVLGLRGMLSKCGDIEVVATMAGGDGRDRVVTDVALFDTYGRVGMPWTQLKALVDGGTAAHVAVYTFDFSGSLVEQALELGVHGYLWKGLGRDELAASIRLVGRGEVVVSTPHRSTRASNGDHRWPFDEQGLSARESEVLALLSEGLSNRDIADALFLNIETVRSHLKSVYGKLGVHTRSQATARALRAGSFDRSAS